MSAPPHNEDPPAPSAFSDELIDSVSETTPDDPWLQRLARSPSRERPPQRSLIGGCIAGRYDILNEAGRGGMGVVYRARDQRGGATVAVKVMTAQGQAAERFLREVRLLAELRHPAIVSYLEHGSVEDGRPYLVMEWLDGEDLGRRLQQGPMTVAEALALLRQVAWGLAHAHGRGVVHRDIKPYNLFLRGGVPADPVILDFGVARAEDGAVGMTRTGAIIGTPSYMSPEQILSPRSVGPAADVFSLGCVLFQCLAGRTPFVGEFADQVLTKIVTTDAESVRTWCPQAPPALDALLGRMLRRDPLGRPADGAALLRELGNL